MQWLATDEQVIERLRLWHRRRRMAGVLLFVLGAAWIGQAIFEVHKLHAQTQAIFAELDQMSRPTTQTFDRHFDATQLNMGLKLGFLLATGLLGGALLALTGLVYVIAQNRQERLLLKCWDDKPKPS